MFLSNILTQYEKELNVRHKRAQAQIDASMKFVEGLFRLILGGCNGSHKSKRITGAKREKITPLNYTKVPANLNFIDNLPPELLGQIFKNLTFKDLLSGMRTCKFWSLVVQRGDFLKAVELDQNQAVEISRYLTHSLISSKTFSQGIFRTKAWEFSKKLSLRISFRLMTVGAAFVFNRAMKLLPPVTQEAVDKINKYKSDEYFDGDQTIDSIELGRSVLACAPMVLTMIHALYDISQVFNAKSRRLIELSVIQQVLCCPPKVAKDLLLLQFNDPGKALVPITPYRLEGSDRAQLNQGNYANPNLRRFVNIQARLLEMIEDRKDDFFIKKIFRERIIYLNPIYLRMLQAMTERT